MKEISNSTDDDCTQEEAVSPRNIARVKEIISNLPSEDLWKAFQPLRLYQGFWCYPLFLEEIILAQERFKAEPSDIFVCSAPKCGTTWIKALTFAVATRARYDDSTNPLLFKSPHDCVPPLFKGLSDNNIREPGLTLLATHAPYLLLPKSVVDSDCKVVYICRNPKDMFVSYFHFVAKRRPKENEIVTLEEGFELFSEGKSFYGPFWDHILGYWKASLERPNNVLFLKYEDMMKDAMPYVRKLAEFMGFPFTPDEEQDKAVKKIVDLCSFESLTNLEVNKKGMRGQNLRNRDYFRKGQVGDWKNWLTPEMTERLNRIMAQKFDGFGLTFDD